MATASETKVIEAYIGLLGRAPDPSGLAYWTAQLDAAGGTTDALKKLTNDITLSAEWDAGLGAQKQADGSISQANANKIVGDMYLNLFERAATATDLTYWGDQLIAGTVTSSEMAVLLIAAANEKGTADGQTLAFKTEAATYYAENVAQADFTRAGATASVSAVDGPNSLADSKAETDAISSGTGLTYALTAGNDAPTMTGGDDVGTGTNLTMGNAGTNIDSIVDGSTSDSDKLTITGDNGFTFGTVTNVESIDVSLAKVNGTAFSMLGGAAVTGTSSAINVTAAPTIELGGATLSGEQSVSLDSQAVDVTTTTVTDYTATAVTNDAISISGDATLKTVTVGAGTATNDTVTVTLANNDSTVGVTLGAGDGDSLTVNADGKVALTASGIETIGVSGVSEAVAVTVAATTASNFSVAGSQNVTINGTEQLLTATTITNSGTGGVTLGLTGSGANKSVDLTGAGTLAGVVIGDANIDSVTLKGATTVSTFNTADAVAIVSNDTTTTNNKLDLVVNGQTVLTETGYEDIGITSNDSVATNIALTTSGTAGTGNDVDIDVSTGNDTTLDVDSTGTAAIDVTLATSGDVALGTNSLATTGASGNVDFTVIATGDITDAATGVTASGNDAAVNVSLTSTGGDVNAQVSLDEIAQTDPVNLLVSAANDAAMTITLAGGGAGSSVGITAGNELTVAAGIDAATNVAGATAVTLTATANDVNVGAVDSNNGDVTMTAGAQILATAAVDAGTGDLSLTSGATGASVITGAVTAAGMTIAAGNDVTFNGGINADAIVMSGAGDVALGNTDAYVVNSQGLTGSLSATFNADPGSLAVTVNSGAGNDILIFNKTDVDFDVTTGDGIDNLTITAAETGSTFLTGGGDDIIGMNIAATDVYTINGGDGNDAITLANGAANDVILTGTGTNTVVLSGTFANGTITGGGTDTLVLDTETYDTLTMSGIDTVDITAGDVVMSAATFAGDNTFLLVDGADGDDEVLTVGTAALTTVQTIDASNVTFNIDKKAKVAVTGGTKDDILTGSTRATTLDGLAGNDTITGGDAADIIGGDGGMDIIVGGGGADIIAGDAGNDTITGGEGADVITGGAGVDTIILTETVAAADDVVIDDDTALNHPVITGWGTGDQIAINESEFATIAFAGTGPVADLNVADYNEIAATQALQTQHVNVITTAAGYASYDDAFAGVAAVGGNAAAPGFVLFYNATTEKTEMYYDADLRDAAGEVLVAQIDIAGANVAGLSEANFTVF